MRKFVVLLLVAMLLAPPLVGTSAQAAPPICTPGALPPGGNGCIPTPQECATGLYNGYWEGGHPERFADCTGYLDPITGRGHVVSYVGGDLRIPCGAIIANDRMQLGGWGDPNRCPPASAEPGYGVKGRAYHEPVSSSRGVVASFSGLASRAGVDVLDAGGNAVDAAIATVFAIGVARPESCGIGGGGFLVYRGADGETAALDFRESAPAAFDKNTLAVEGINKKGTGHLVVGVPGTVAGMAAASERYGALPWADLLAPATKLAKEGVPVTSEISDLMFVHEARLNRFPETKEIYLKDGLAFPPTPISKPEDFVQSDYAASLRAIAEKGPDVFYKGDIAKLIVEEMKRSAASGVAGGQGVMTMDDLANYSAVWRTPLTGKYRDAQLVTMPPPTSGGIFTLEVLNLLEGFDLPKMKHSSADHLHLFAEAQKIAWADRNAYVADPGFVDVPTAELTSKKYADERRSEIKRDQAGTYEAGSLGATAGTSSATGTQNTNTTHVSVIDAAGNAVAVTCTIEQPFGSGVVALGTGFLLNNQLTDFDGPGTANEPAAGKRPRSSTSPTIVVLRGRPILVVGGVGGPAIPMGVTMTVSNMVDFAMDVAHAVDAARLDERTCCTMLLEASRVPAGEIAELERRHHTIERAGEYHFQPTLTAAGVNRETGARIAVSDPRSNGEPAAQLPN